MRAFVEVQSQIKHACRQIFPSPGGAGGFDSDATVLAVREFQISPQPENDDDAPTRTLQKIIACSPQRHCRR